MCHVEDSQSIRLIQHGVRKSRSYLANLISFYNQVTCWVDEGKAADVVHLDFSKAFHTILLESWQPIAWTGALFTG